MLTISEAYSNVFLHVREASEYEPYPPVTTNYYVGALPILGLGSHGVSFRVLFTSHEFITRGIRLLHEYLLYLPSVVPPLPPVSMISYKCPPFFYFLSKR